MQAFSQRIATAKSSREVYLVTGGHDHTGHAAWHFIRVDRHKQGVFERALRTGQMNLTEYGTILASGYGKGPPPETVNKMGREHGYQAA